MCCSCCNDNIHHSAQSPSRLSDCGMHLHTISLLFIFLKGITDALTKVAKNEKLPGLYKGFGPTLVAIAPFVAIQQISYDLLKYKARSMKIEPSVMLFLGCGSIAGVTAQTVCIFPSGSKNSLVINTNQMT